MIRRTTASMRLARFCSDRDGPELCCSFADKQHTLQDSNHHTAEMENAGAVPSSREARNRPRAHSPARLMSTAGHKTHPVPAAKCQQLQPGWESPVPAPRLLVLGARSMPGMRRGAGCGTVRMLDPSASLAKPQHKRVWCTHLSVGSSQVAPGAFWAWEPFGQGPLCSSAQHGGR